MMWVFDLRKIRISGGTGYIGSNLVEIPVIASSVGDVPVLVKNGIKGIVIPPGKADMLAESIIYLAENPELRKHMGKANVRKMKEYDWNKIAKQYHTIYSEMLNS